jgi:outer membrane cobalamin receptor
MLPRTVLLMALLLVGSAALARPPRDDDDDRPARARPVHQPVRHDPEDDDDDRPASAGPSGPAPVSPADNHAGSRPDEEDDKPAAPAASVRDGHDDDDDDEPSRAETPIIVTALRLDVAREDIEPALGATRYSLTNDAIEARPGGETTTLAQILQQVPGVANGGSGPLIVRGARGAVQYRFNNVIIPDSMGDVGERLSSRLAARVDLLTGALPAQYGGGAVVNVVTKNGTYLKGGQAELYGGSHHELEPAFEASLSHGATSGFVSASLLSSRLGLPAPDGSATPLHDRTRQAEGFAFLDHVLDDRSRVSLIVGGARERFEIPALRGTAASALSTRRERGGYLAASYLFAAGQTTLQASLFARRASSRLVGPAPRADRRSSGGVQVEAVQAIGAAHKLRAGTVLAAERLSGAGGARTRQRSIQSLFLQDEWIVTDGLTLNAGLRLDRAGSQSGGSALGPRLGIVYQHAETTFHAAYAHYFLAAPLDRLPLPTPHGPSATIISTLAFNTSPARSPLASTLTGSAPATSC